MGTLCRRAFSPRRRRVLDSRQPASHALRFEALDVQCGDVAILHRPVDEIACASIAVANLSQVRYSIRPSTVREPGAVRPQAGGSAVGSGRATPIATVGSTFSRDAQMTCPRECPMIATQTGTESVNAALPPRRDSSRVSPAVAP